MKISDNKGSAPVIIFVVFLAAIVMFIFPLMKIADEQDDATQLAAQQAVTNFGNKAVTTGRITQEDYDNLVLTLSTGRAYNVEVTIQVLDENPAKKTSSATTEIDGKTYYIQYDTQFKESLKNNSGVVNLKEGDNITVKAITIDESIGEQLKNWAYKAIGNNPRTVEYVGMVTTTAK